MKKMKMNLRRLLLLAIAPCLSCALLQAEEAAVRPGGIVATVGDDAITQSDLDRRLALELNSRGGSISTDDLKQNKPALERFVLDKMIDDLLILQEIWQLRESKKGEKEAEEKKETSRPVAGASRISRTARYISEEAVDREIKRRIETLRESRINVRNEIDFYQHIEQTTGLDRAQIRAYIREEVGIRRYLWEKVFSAVDPFVAPRESRVYYENHVGEFTTPVEVSFRQIFLLPDRINSFVAIKKISEGLENKVPFVDLAKEFSQDFDSPEARGRVWERSFEELRSWLAPIPDKLKTMSQGEVAGPFRTDAGIYFLELVDRVDGQPKSYEDVQEEIEKKIVRARQELKFEMFMEELRRRSHIEKLLAGARGATGADGDAEKTAGEGAASPADEEPGEREVPETEPETGEAAGAPGG
ncbi:MAG: peptidyl-prolyl cis-trans isomerase [Planctomycetes bacterium]|nr:peptidyl-prolyl cis-trans isomerase [Planctomycetota bacterium]